MLRQRSLDLQKNKNKKGPKQQLCRCSTLFSYISLTPLHVYNGKFPHGTFYGQYVGREHTSTNFSVFLNLGLVPKNSIPDLLAYEILSVLTPCGFEFAVGSFKRSPPRVYSPGYSSYLLSSNTNTFTFQFYLSGETTGHRFICDS